MNKFEIYLYIYIHTQIYIYILLIEIIQHKYFSLLSVTK